MGYQTEFGTLLDAIAEEADAIALKFFRTGDLRVDRKGDGSPVTQADRGVEEMARAKVSASGLALDVLGEEMGGEDAKAPGTSGRARLIIDPIDGTEEFSRGIPIFGTLLGIERDGEIVAGMASAPALATRWCAYRGEGAYRNGKRIHVSTVTKMSESMTFTTGAGPSKDAAARARLRKLLDTARNGRSIGGFWQHMLVAEGSVEAAVDLTSKPWDLAPLGIIVEEAGGRSTNIAGVRTIYTGDFVSTNGKLHEEVLELLR
ncbi:MAG TPA: inositol monophosphatase family protein [Candidatus Saccharimonadales bacterium]|nr:inositol monophosphatase family protein [Candidatus Saccharimonadales bacterium]